MAVDLHPDIVAAINEFASTKLGHKFARYARKNYHMSGKKLLAKQTAAEFGGRSTKTGRGVVSSAGARGPAQFIPSTRAGYIKQYGFDPWASDKNAFKGMAIHDMGTGVAGYNPGMPSYTGLVLGQKINPADIAALRNGSTGGGGGSPGRRPSTKVTREKYTVPGTDYSAERTDARRGLLSGGITMQKLLAYKAQVNDLQDTPDKQVSGDIVVKHDKGKAPSGGAGGGKASDGFPQGYKGKKGGIYEVFHDPLGKYWDSGGVQSGAIGGHSDHVHVSADRGYIVKIAKFAQHMGLNVSGQRRFGGTPTSGHVAGSFHYRDMGIDVSGDPAKMAAFAKRVMRAAKHGHGR